MTQTTYVQLPPDGVGKKIRHRLLTDLEVTVSSTPAIGSTVYTTGGASGILEGVYSSDVIIWHLREVSGTIAKGDALKDVTLATTYATVSAVIDPQTVYIPALNIVDPEVPEYALTVDKRGAALTSFPEGTPQFDAWGRQQLSQLQAVAEYYFFTQDLSGKFYTTTNGASSAVKHNPANSALVFTTGTGATDWAKRTSNQYHPYKPGVSQLIYLGMATGDTGKANVIREWGYFDDFNGFGFRLDGTTLKVFRRSDQTGTVVDTEVTQANWNINTLDNAVTSDFLLSVNAPNIYWMDVQAQSARIRLGVQTPDGRRITCHEFRQVNGAVGLGLRNLSLPVTWAQRNTGSVSSSPASTQFMLTGGGAVFTESADILYTGSLMHISPNDPISFSDSTVYKPFLQFKAKNRVAGPTQAATDIVTGFNYTIVSTGTTNWTGIGASANVAGVKFTATGSGAGTGTAYVNLPNSIIGIHETFDWASQGDTNLHVGIFVLPNENWLVGFDWSETIQPATMLYVDQNSTSMAQYQYWSPAATAVAGSIAGNVMTVSSVTGSVLKETYITTPPLYANGPLSAGFAATSGNVTARTRVVRQLTSTASAVASPTYGTQSGGSGVAGSNRLVISSATGVSPGQLIAGTNLPQGTIIQDIDSTTLTLNRAFTGTGTGTYNCYAVGGAGTYLVDPVQTVVSFSSFGAYYAFGPIESFVAPQNSAGRAALGDRIEKSFGLGGNPDPAEDAKAVFAFAAKPQKAATTATLLYTKYWKEIR